MNDYFIKILTLSGLTEEQAGVYSCLIADNYQMANSISRKSNLGRSMTYKVLSQLIKLELVEKIEPTGEIARFKAEHPQKVLDFIEQKRKQVEENRDLLSSEIGKLVAHYNLTLGKPNIRFIEGINGLKQINNEIVIENKPIKLIRSIMDKENPEAHEAIKDQMSKRVARGLKTYIVGPLPAGNNTDIKLLKEKDALKIIERRVIDNLNIPTQIIIFGRKVAITDYKNNVISTIIENESVATSFEKIFDLLFASGRRAY